MGINTIKTNGLIILPAQRQLIAYGKYEFEVVKVFNLKFFSADDIASLGNQSNPFSRFCQTTRNAWGQKKIFSNSIRRPLI